MRKIWWSMTAVGAVLTSQLSNALAQGAGTAPEQAVNPAPAAVPAPPPGSSDAAAAAPNPGLPTGTPAPATASTPRLPIPTTSESAPKPAPKDEPENNQPELSKKLGIATEGWFQPTLNLQAWFLLNKTSGVDTAATFRIRRAEIGAKGDIIKDCLGYGVMIDPAKLLEFQDKKITLADGSEITTKQPVSSVSFLQDVFITFQSEYADVSLGQFKIPVSWEGYNSSSKLLFPERAAVSRQFGDKRDLGLRVAKTMKYVGYSAGLFNGTGQNTLDTNSAKDGALRLEVYPVKGLTVAGVVYASLWDRDSVGSKDRFEGDLRFEAGPFLFQGEYLRSKDVGSAGGVNGQGFYAAAGVTVLDKLQPVVRVGYMDPDTDSDLAGVKPGDKDELWHIDAGLNYYLLKNEAKLQLNYSRSQYDDVPASNEVILAAQVAF